MAGANPAETYESFMVPTLFGPWAARLVEHAGPRPGQRVLDVGCGTGVVARTVAPLVEPGGSVTGLDISPDMLAVAHATATREGVDVAWRQGPAEEMTFPDGSFDLALSQFALMFFADRDAALREIHRTLIPGGRVALSVWQGLDRHPFYHALHEAIRKRLGMSSVSDIFSLGDAAELRSLLCEAGFGSVEIESITMTARFPNPDRFLAGEIDVDTAAIPSMQGLDAQARQEVITAIRDDMEGPLREVTRDDHVVIPFHAHVTRAERSPR